MTSISDAAAAERGRMRSTGRAPTAVLDQVDWRDVAHRLIGRDRGPVALQLIVRDDDGDPADLRFLAVVHDGTVPGFTDDLVGESASQCYLEWDRIAGLAAVQRAIDGGAIARHAVRLAGVEPGWFLLEIASLGGDLVLVSFRDLDEVYPERTELDERPIGDVLPPRNDELCIIATPRGRIRHVSPSFATLVGQPVDELVRTGLAGVIDIDSAARLVASCGRLAAGLGDDADVEHEVMVPGHDGRPIHTTWSLRHVPEVGIVAIGGDVTARVETERELRSVLDAVESPIVLSDGEHSVFLNRAWAEFTGRSDRGMISWHPDDRPLIVGAMARATETGVSTAVEARLRRSDGEWRWMLGSVSPVEFEGGTMLVGLAVDIHDQRMAETRLQEIAELVPDVVFRMAMFPEPRHEYISPAYERMTGHSLEEHSRDPLLGFEGIHPDDRSTFLSMFTGERDDIVVRSRRRDGTPYWMSIRCHHERDEGGRVVAVTGVARDVTELKRIEHDLEHRATHDALTDLPNRTLLAEVLERSLARWQRNGIGELAVLFVDLDRFKLVNDTHGHDVGDALLRRVAERLLTSVRASDTVARLGGDEFAVLIEAASVSETLTVARRAIAGLDAAVEVDGYELFAAASGGLAFARGDTVDAGEMLRHADTALARAKERGRNRIELFDDRLRDALERRHRLEQQLRSAVDASDVVVRHQPIVDLASGRIVAVEALARWTTPDGVEIAPSSFIPLAEETGAIGALGRHVLRSSLAALARWHRDGHVIDLNVNVSARQLSDDRIVTDVLESLEAAGVDPHHLCLEVTESVLVSDGHDAAERLGKLRGEGVQVALDDFGTGFSSLSYLDRLPIDIVKVDRSFVSRVDGTTGDRRSRAVTRSIIDLATALDLRPYAEGIETVAQRDHLVGLRCDRGQGFLFARALTADEIGAVLRHGGMLSVDERDAESAADE